MEFDNTQLGQQKMQMLLRGGAVAGVGASEDTHPESENEEARNNFSANVLAAMAADFDDLAAQFSQTAEKNRQQSQNAAVDLAQMSRDIVTSRQQLSEPVLELSALR